MSSHRTRIAYLGSKTGFWTCPQRPRATHNFIIHRPRCFSQRYSTGTSYEKMLNYIRTVKTQTGLRVRANLLAKRYARGIEISDGLMNQINIRGGRVLPAWNYTIHARGN